MFLSLACSLSTHAYAQEPDETATPPSPNPWHNRTLVEIYAREQAILRGTDSESRRLAAQGTDTQLQEQAKDQKSEQSTQEEPLSSELLPFFWQSSYARNAVEVTALPVAPTSDVLMAGGGLARWHAPGLRLWGAEVAPDLNISTSYNDNIFLRSGLPGFEKEGDFITTISPSVMFQLHPFEETVLPPDTTHLNLILNPSFLFFAEQRSQDSINQYHALRLGHRFSKLSFYLFQTYNSVSGGDIQAGDLFDNEWYTTDISVEYQIALKTSIEVAPRLVTRTYDQGFNSHEVSNIFWLNHDLTPKMKISAGPGVGFIDVAGPNQYYFTASARAIYYYSEKTSFFTQISGEVRDAQSNNQDERYNASFRAGATVQLAPKTILDLEASRREQPSNTFEGQNISITGAEGTLTQNLTEQLSVKLRSSYDYSDYVANNNQTTATRTDHFVSVSPSLRYSPWVFWDWSVGYAFRKNFSTTALNRFDNHVFSISSTIKF